MKILLYGHNGWIGNRFSNIIVNKGHVVVMGKSRLENIDNLQNEVERVSPDRVVSMTGRTHGGGIKNIDYLEGEGKLTENMRDNMYGPLMLSIVCGRLKIHYTYLGTGCIFNSGSEEFDESNGPNFFGSSYSIVKGFTDSIMKTCDNVLNVRIRIPIADDGSDRNLITKLLGYKKICSIPNSMTVLPELLPILLRMVEDKEVGTINLVNPGSITHNDILGMYREIVDDTHTWENFTVEEQNEILKAKRSNCVLSSRKLRSYTEVKNIKDSVREMIVSMKNMKNLGNVLVTGGCGFIGSNFINYLGGRVVIVDRMDYCARKDNLKRLDHTIYECDICDTEKMLDIFRCEKINTIIHFAAQSSVDNSFNNSSLFTRDNVMGTHSILEAIRFYGKISTFLHMSTDEVYGEVSDSSKGNVEASILSPTNPYAASKAAAEMLVLSYIRSFNIPAIIIRSNNVFGDNQYPEKILPKFILQVASGKKCTIHGDGTALRTFLHAEDLSRAILTILKCGSMHEVYNIGTDDEHSVLAIARKIIHQLGKTDIDSWIDYVDDRDFNDHRYCMDCTKISGLGWKPSKLFDEELPTLTRFYVDRHM